MPAIDDLLANNARYAERFDKGDLPVPPGLSLAVVACMDARLDTHSLLGIGEGDAHVIRNAGGVVTDDAIRSLTISQRLLGTTSIMLIHHTDCGMLTFRDDDVKDAIMADTGLRPAFALEAFTDLEGDVRQSMARIQASPFIPNKDDVRGFVYDCATGKLNEVIWSSERAWREVRVGGGPCCRMRKGRGHSNARRYRVGASTGRSVVMMAKTPSASRTGTERVIIQISPPPASK